MSKFIRNLIIIVLGLGLAAAVFFTYQPKKNNEQNIAPNNYEQSGQESYQAGEVTMQKYRNADLGLSFEYRKEPDGYTLVDQEVPDNGEYTFEKLLVLMNTNEYNEFIVSQVAREGPLAISVAIYNNFKNLTAQDWAVTWTRLSLYELALSPMADVSLGGVSGVRYKTDGLYPTDKIVLNNNSKIYVISGNYNSPEDEIKKDFEKFLESLLFF